MARLATAVRVLARLAPLLIPGALVCAPAPAPGVSRALARIRPEALRGHVAALADDRLEGRGTGTRGYRLAAEYVAERFRALALEPGAGDGSWLQEVPMRRARVDEDPCALALVHADGAERVLEYGTDYVLSPDFLREHLAIAAPLVLAGYGVSAPELGWDDYAGLDVRGRVVIMFSGAPRRFPSDQRAYYSWNTGKQRNAAAHGARGILVVRTPVDEARTTWERLLRQSRLPSFHWIGPDGEPHDAFAGLHVVGTLNRPAAATLFRDAGHSLDSLFARADTGQVAAFELPLQVRARHATGHQAASSPNVIGRLPGSDPALRDEVVVYTAHLDHLGISAPVNGDSINNGAYDNASGVAVMLEIARAFAALEPRPRRSILFVAVTGEEKGLQGSDYFARFPPVPIERIVADVNLDMFLMLRPLRDVVAFGAEHSSLGPVVERAARSLGIAVSPDPVPDEVVFIRSDQFAFVRAGVPSVFPTHGRGTTPADTAVTRRWMRTIYHSPQDDLRQLFDWSTGAKFAQFGFLIGHEIANATERPAWNPGDFFGERFGRKP